MKNEKILITGGGSPVSQAFARSLAGDNEVWVASRFGDAAARKSLDDAGVKTVSVDIGSGAFDMLPTDFSYLLHLAYFRGPRVSDLTEALRVNGEGTGLILHHCRNAKAALYMSSSTIYGTQDDPWYVYNEEDAIGGTQSAYSATAGVSKVAGEVIARYCARQFDLPVTIARLNAPYGNGHGMMPTIHMDMVMADKPVTARWDPEPYTPIHLDDMCDQIDAMLDAASIPATIINWCGDEHVTVQDWTKQAADWGGKSAEILVQPIAGSKRGVCSDMTRRKALTGPCKVNFTDGLREIFDARYGARIDQPA